MGQHSAQHTGRKIIRLGDNICCYLKDTNDENVHDRSDLAPAANLPIMFPEEIRHQRLTAWRRLLGESSEI
jgi:hypothetical protein